MPRTAWWCHCPTPNSACSGCSSNARGGVLNRELLLDAARGRAIEAFDRSIDLLVSRLRQKLGDDPRSPRLIKTVRGEGYLFDVRDIA